MGFHLLLGSMWKSNASKSNKWLCHPCCKAAFVIIIIESCGRILAHSFLLNCFNLATFYCFRAITACLRSCQSMLIGFKPGLWQDHSKTLYCWGRGFRGELAGVFWIIVLLPNPNLSKTFVWSVHTKHFPQKCHQDAFWQMWNDPSCYFWSAVVFVMDAIFLQSLAYFWMINKDLNWGK